MPEFGKLNLAAFESHKIVSFPTSDPKVKIECIVIPIAKNNLFKSDKGNVYLDLVAFEQKNPQTDKDGAITQTHLVKQSLPKEIREKQTKEEKMAQPIIGSLCILGGKFSQTEHQAVVDKDLGEPSEDDLPF